MNNRTIIGSGILLAGVVAGLVFLSPTTTTSPSGLMLSASLVTVPTNIPIQWFDSSTNLSFVRDGTNYPSPPWINFYASMGGRFMRLTCSGLTNATSVLALECSEDLQNWRAYPREFFQLNLNATNELFIPLELEQRFFRGRLVAAQ